MKLEQEFVDAISEAPDSQLDALCVDVVKSWELNPSALDILRLLDDIVYYSLGSEFSVMLFKTLLDEAIKEEGTTYEEVIKLRVKGNKSEKRLFLL